MRGVEFDILGVVIGWCWVDSFFGEKNVDFEFKSVIKIFLKKKRKIGMKYYYFGFEI